MVRQIGEFIAPLAGDRDAVIAQATRVVASTNSRTGLATRLDRTRLKTTPRTIAPPPTTSMDHTAVCATHRARSLPANMAV